MTNNLLTAKDASLIGCPMCNKVYRIKPLSGKSCMKCSRCGITLYSRKPKSIQRTWALVITAIIMYIPANLFPIMTVTEFGRGTPDTIISGIIALFHNELWSIGILVFTASILIPVLKLLALILLLLSIQFKWEWSPKQRTLLYKMIETIGRWSMLDIFMMSIVIALVKLGLILNVEPNLGASAFASVVIITMFAAMSFDPRLIWDREKNYE